MEEDTHESKAPEAAAHDAHAAPAHADGPAEEGHDVHGGHDAHGSGDPKEQRFKRMLAIVIALLTVLGALIAHVQADAADEDDVADRQAKQASIEAFGTQIRGAADSNYNFYTGYEQYREMDTLREAAEKRGDTRAAEHYETLRDNLGDTCPLLSARDPKGEAYFDPQKDAGPDLARYEAFTYLIQVEAERQTYKAAAAVKDGFEDKANNYITVLTVLAVAMFLLGLAGTIATPATRTIFAGAGLVIAAITIAWALEVHAKPVEDLREHKGAIVAYAEAAGEVHMHHQEEAVKGFSTAIGLAPEYSDAYLGRARAYLALEKPELDKAQEDLKRVRELDPENPAVFVELARAQYLSGAFDTAAATCQEGLKSRPEDIELHFQLGLAKLAAGQTEAAKEAIKEGDEAAARACEEATAKKEEIPSDIISYLYDLSIQLENVSIVIEDKKGLPPPDKIQQGEEIKKDAIAMSNDAASWEMALENTGKPPSGQLAARIDELTFTDEDGKEVDDKTGFPADTGQVKLHFKYSGMQNGQTVIIRVYHDGEEIESWRDKSKWKDGAAGNHEDVVYPGYSDTFHFEPGSYLVEVYVDYHFTQDGTFTVAGEESPDKE